MALLKCSRDANAVKSLGRRILDGSNPHWPRNEQVGRALCTIGVNATIMERYAAGEAREMYGGGVV